MRTDSIPTASEMLERLHREELLRSFKLTKGGTYIDPLIELLISQPRNYFKRQIVELLDALRWMSRDLNVEMPGGSDFLTDLYRALDDMDIEVDPADMKFHLNFAEEYATELMYLLEGAERNPEEEEDPEPDIEGDPEPGTDSEE